MYKTAIAVRVGRTFQNGLTGSWRPGTDLGAPDYVKACLQHDCYVAALRQCGVEVVVLDASEDYPDSTFVEDVAVLTKECAIITNPKPKSRKGEVIRIKTVLGEYYSVIESVTCPGTLEGGDVLQIGDTFYIGISQRTNTDGAQQLSRVLTRYGYRVSIVPLGGMFHLKCLVSRLGENYITIAETFASNEAFAGYNKVIVDEDEAYCCNVLSINGRVLIPSGYPKTKQKIAKAGFSVIELDMSEFQKQDGSLTCLSLRF